MFWRVLRSVQLVFQISSCIYFVRSAICMTDSFRFFIPFQERVLLFLPESATCTTDFSDFLYFSRSVCSFFYLNRQPVRPIFSIFMLFQERVLLYLPESVTCVTDFSSFTSFLLRFLPLGWG